MRSVVHYMCATCIGIEIDVMVVAAGRKWIRRCHIHDSLLAHVEEEALSREEQQEVWLATDDAVCTL